MKIKTDEITSVIKKEIEQFSQQLEISEVGQVVEIGDGIARVYGLSKAMSGELVEFDSEGGVVTGQIMNLETDMVGVAIFGNATRVREGDTVRSTGRLLEVPAGPELLGRVQVLLGRSIARHLHDACAISRGLAMPSLLQWDGWTPATKLADLQDPVES